MPSPSPCAFFFYDWHSHHPTLRAAVEVSLIFRILASVPRWNWHFIHPPDTKGKYGESERTARPVPLDIDGDGVVESIVVPVFLKRKEVTKEREMELLDLQKNKKKKPFFTKNDDKVDEKGLEGWAEDGSWGLRVLNLKPLHRSEADEKEGMIAGPFAPRTFVFIASFISQDATENLVTASVHIEGTTTNITHPETYPIKIPSIFKYPSSEHTPGRSRKITTARHKKEGGSSSSFTYGKNSDIPPKDDSNHDSYDRTRHYFCGKDWHHASRSFVMSIFLGGFRASVGRGRLVMLIRRATYILSLTQHLPHEIL
mmetsp:Transcript_3918/g.8790  ORF Transcript_3918/g.8790 Transcript_3918/m.8790 type:complete len:313 (+) Transcript_3918:342-1280(+)